ncbi:MAG: c-type cytochrome [Roseivirga sp.]|nr:c-type cytochrome [Roseivirga sp.]
MKVEDAIQRVFSLVKVLVALYTLVLVLVILMHNQPSLFANKATANDSWSPRNINTDLGDSREDRLAKYGYEVITQSSRYIGPLAEAGNRYAGNNLSCQNCHLEGGTKRGSASFVGVANRFPQFRGRENKMGTLAERINGCMERSMNGKALPENSLEMQAMIAYMKWLSTDVPAEREAEYKGFVKVVLPEAKADPVLGKAVFVKHCQTCHMADGQGQRPDPNGPYVYPPLWGTDTYNHGAGMHRVITAAQFIKGNMPHLQATWDNPILSDEEAYHVAAYINSMGRAQKSNPGTDFPDKKLKPVSTPYGPWTDSFSSEQHKYGPFQPIMAFYEREFGIKKGK